MVIISDLDDIETEFTNAENNASWKAMFSNLKCESDKLSENIVINEAKIVTNKARNRYRDVLPYDCTRVLVHGIAESDYINANYVQLQRCKSQRRYILTQGPLTNTISHFWKMIWDEQSSCIVMLNKLIEKNMVKCALYFPTSLDEIMTYEYEKNMKLSISLIEIIDKGSYTKRVFSIIDTSSNESRRIFQFHYSSWPDFGVPLSPVSFLEFLNDVRSSGGLNDPERPAVIHCSAGIGRSGTFILIDLALLLIEDYAGRVDLKEMLLELRQCRMGLVQAAEQLRFVYLAVMVAAKTILGSDLHSGINVVDEQNGENINDTSSSENDSDSDFSDGSDIMRSNSALDQAAAAVRRRRGIPMGTALEDSFNASHSNHNIEPSNNCSPDSKVIEDRKIIRENRCKRTREKVEEIRSNMRRLDLERDRLINRLGLQRLRNSLTGCTKHSVVLGVSIIVGVFSFACGLAIYKYVA